jgi:hypothetical protein
MDPIVIPPVIMGTLDMLLQKQTFKNDPQRGITVLSEYGGAGLAAAIALYNNYAFNGVTVDLAQEKGVFKLSANDATGNNPIDTWEILGDAERKDLFQMPKWSGAISNAEMAAIRYYLGSEAPAHGPANVGGAFDAPVAANIPANTASLVALAGGVVERAYARYQAGNDEFENDAYAGGYVLKHTTNVNARWTVNVADFQVGQIYTTAELLTEIGNSALWNFPAPARIQYKVNAAGLNAPTAQPFYTWGWKKCRSNEETAANCRVNIVQHYVLELWSTDDYGTF